MGRAWQAQHTNRDKENEDKWKRLSRQIADVILPMLARQQVCPPSALLPWGHVGQWVTAEGTPSAAVGTALCVQMSREPVGPRRSPRSPWDTIVLPFP